MAGFVPAIDVMTTADPPNSASRRPAVQLLHKIDEMQ